jgi:hypothetical protein
VRSNWHYSLVCNETDHCMTMSVQDHVHWCLPSRPLNYSRESVMLHCMLYFLLSGTSDVTTFTVTVAVGDIFIP